MSIFSIQRIYTSSSFKANKSKSEILGMWRDRKDGFKFRLRTYMMDAYYTTFRVTKEGVTIPAIRLLIGPGRMDVSIHDHADGSSTLKFDLYTLHPSLVKIVVLIYCALVFFPFFNGWFSLSGKVQFLSLALLAMVLLLIILFFYLSEKISRYFTGRCIHRLMMELSE